MSLEGDIAMADIGNPKRHIEIPDPVRVPDFVPEPTPEPVPAAPPEKERQDA